MEQIIEYTWHDYLNADFDISLSLEFLLQLVEFFWDSPFCRSEVQLKSLWQVVPDCARDRYLELPVITFKFHWEQC